MHDRRWWLIGGLTAAALLLLGAACGRERGKSTGGMDVGAATTAAGAAPPAHWTPEKMAHAKPATPGISRPQGGRRPTTTPTTATTMEPGRAAGGIPPAAS
jgi:hypothetical protein